MGFMEIYEIAGRIANVIIWCFGVYYLWIFVILKKKKVIPNKDFTKNKDEVKGK